MDIAQAQLDIAAWEAIAEHRTATPGDKATDQWLRKEIAACGQTPQTRNYDFDRLDIADCGIEIDDQRLPAVPMFDAVPGTVEGVIGESIDLLRFHPTDQHPATLEFKSRRQSTPNSAMIAVAETDSSELGLLNAEAYRTRTAPIVVQVAGSYWDELQHAKNHKARVRVIAEGEFTSTFATNIECSIEGRDRAASPLVVMTPKSSWWTSTAERMGGIAIWLALLRHFAAHPPRRTVLFTANSGHELSHLGLDHFVASNNQNKQNEQHASWLPGVYLWLHLGANFAARGGAVRIQASTPHWMANLDAALMQHNIKHTATPVTQRPAGEARNIYDLQGDFVSVLGSNPWFHQPNDHGADVMDMHKLQAIGAAVQQITDTAANA